MDPSTDPNANQNKKKGDHNKLINKREELTTMIRQEARDKYFQGKRGKYDLPNGPIQQLNILDNVIDMDEKQTTLKQHIDQCLKKSFTLNDFISLVEAINSDDILNQHYGVIGIRKVLSVDTPPIQNIIDANLVPRLIQFMQLDKQPHLQLESAWALTNVASGTTHQTQTIIDKGGIPFFINLLKSPHPEVAEQAVWAIGNIAGDSYIYRDMILKFGGLSPLIKIIKESKNKNTVKQGTWALSNLCRGRPLPKFELVSPATTVFCEVIQQQFDDVETVTDSAWALSYLSDGNEQRIQEIINTGVVKYLVELLPHPFLSIIIPTVRILGNIVTGNDSQTQHVLSFGALDRLFQLLKHDKKAVRREVCWTLSNITAGNKAQISFVIQNQNYLNELINLIKNDSVEIQREAAWVISNATNKGDPQDIYKMLIEFRMMEVFVQLLASEDVKTLAVVLEAIKNILDKGNKFFIQNDENLFLKELENFGGIVKIEALQKHPNDDIYKKAINLLEQYYEIDDPF